jgi:hypothetical protein
MQANCTGCHGSTANQTGLGYRLDFYDMPETVCGDAAAALPAGAPLAASWAPKIATAVTPSTTDGRARMPPLPGPSLASWQRETLLRWTAQPIKGAPPEGNHAPTVQIFGLPSQASDRLTFTAVVADPDGDEAVGVIEVGNITFAMNRSGAFAADFSVASLPAGSYRLTGVSCDGWTNATYDLGPLEIKR